MKSIFYGALLVTLLASLHHYVSGQECRRGEHAAHPNLCERFIRCSNGKFVEMFCPPGLYFNPEVNVCDWPVNVNCTPSYQTPPSWSSTTQSVNTTTATPPNSNSTNPNSNTTTTTSNNTFSIPVNPTGTTPNITSFTATPLAMKCSDASEPATLPHPNCNYFYMCGHGYAYVSKCQDGLTWNQIKEYCDYPENSNCVDGLAPLQ